MPKSEITIGDEFASTMQQLVAEAAKTAPSAAATSGDHTASVPNETAAAVANLAGRLDGLERAMAAGFEKLAAAMPPKNDPIAAQLTRVDEHMVAMRNTDTVNQRLFNSLHQELKEYRDNFLRDSLQKPFIRDLVVLFDDLSGLSSQMQSASASAERLEQWNANLENAIHSLMEIMHRMEVSETEPREMVDRSLHRVVSYEPADFAEDDGRIVMRVKRGFMWRDQVLRPEDVVAKRFG